MGCPVWEVWSGAHHSANVIMTIINTFRYHILIVAFPHIKKTHIGDYFRGSSSWPLWLETERINGSPLFLNNDKSENQLFSLRSGVGADYWWNWPHCWSMCKNKLTFSATTLPPLTDMKQHNQWPHDVHTSIQSWNPHLHTGIFKFGPPACLVDVSVK